MKTSRLLSVIACTLGLSGCFLPSGVNPTLGCSPILGCTERDYYLPGKGVWAPKPVVTGKKAWLGTIVGAGIGSYAGRGGDPWTLAAFTVGGLVLGHEVGAMFDKVDPIKISKEISIPIQGGLNPKVLLTDKDNLGKEVKKYLNIFKDHPYIFNLGHGILPETNPNMVDYLVKTVKDY